MARQVVFSQRKPKQGSEIVESVKNDDKDSTVFEFLSDIKEMVEGKNRIIEQFEAISNSKVLEGVIKEQGKSMITALERVVPKGSDNTAILATVTASLEGITKAMSDQNAAQNKMMADIIKSHDLMNRELVKAVAKKPGARKVGPVELEVTDRDLTGALKKAVIKEV